MGIEQTLQKEIEDTKSGSNAHKKIVLTNEIFRKELN